MSNNRCPNCKGFKDLISKNGEYYRKCFECGYTETDIGIVIDEGYQ